MAEKSEKHLKVCKDKSKELKIFVGNYVHSESDEFPLVEVQNGVIGVENGTVSYYCQL